MKKLLILCAIGTGLIVPSVVWASGATPVGVVYNQTSTGLSTNNGVKATKEGKTCSYSILSLIAFGDATVNKAKADGDITNVASVDNTSFNVLGVYGRYCTVVKGN